MTWWQTLIIAVGPAIVTALSLLGQQWISRSHDRRSKADDRAHAALQQRRDERLAVHRDAIAVFTSTRSYFEHQLTRATLEQEAGLASTGPIQGLDPISVERLNQAIATVELACSPVSARCAKGARVHLHRVHEATNARPQSLAAVNDAVVRYLIATREYVQAAIEDVDLTPPGRVGAVALPPQPAPPAQE